MEFVAGITILIVAFVVVHRKRNTTSRDRDRHHRIGWEKSVDQKNVVPITSKPRRSDFSPFDQKTSRHLKHGQVLTGPAYIIDGDTITVRKTQIRLFGIDAPELDHPYGKRAKWALHALCKGKRIRAEITDIDDYGRTVAKCYLPDGRDLSAEMVKAGLALDWPKFSGGSYRALETSDARRKLFLADARQKGRMHVWENFENDSRTRDR